MGASSAGLLGPLTWSLKSAGNSFGSVYQKLFPGFNFATFWHISMGKLGLGGLTQLVFVATGQLLAASVNAQTECPGYAQYARVRSSAGVLHLADLKVFVDASPTFLGWSPGLAVYETRARLQDFQQYSCGGAPSRVSERSIQAHQNQ